MSKTSPGKLFVPSLSLAFFSTYVIELLTGLYLVDIAIEFFGSSNPISIATASQLVTLSSVAAVIAGLIVGIFSVRFSHKKLLILGTSCVAIGVLGCYLAQNFVLMQIFYPIEGVGTMVVGAMSFTLVGEFLALNKRGKATGWIVAGGPIGGILANLVASIFFKEMRASWRPFLLWFALPISLAALVSVYFGVPPSSRRFTRRIGKATYFSSFKQVFLKKSAAGCLIGNMMRQAGFAWGVFSITFFRTQFGVSLELGALISLGGTVVFILAILTGGQMVNMIGRKRLLVTTLICSSPFLPLITFIPNLWIALAINWVGSFIYAMGFPGSVNLTLEQTPEFRGTMMSMSSIFITLGFGLGTALGGVLLVFFENYLAVILAFITLQFAAAAIYFFLTEDPCTT
jgi:MFS family permease